MKNQLLSIIVLALLTLTACKQAEPVEQAEMPDYAAFDAKVETIRSFIKAHCDEDLEALAGIFSDTIQFSPPNYNGNTWLGKDDLLAILKNYHDNFENIQYVEGITLPDTTANGFYSGSVFPKSTATTNPGVIRVYGTWSATHTESGKPIGAKWFSVVNVNADGKIAMFSDYFDANGLAVQIAEADDE